MGFNESPRKLDKRVTKRDIVEAVIFDGLVFDSKSTIRFTEDLLAAFHLPYLYDSEAKLIKEISTKKGPDFDELRQKQLVDTHYRRNVHILPRNPRLGTINNTSRV